MPCKVTDLAVVDWLLEGDPSIRWQVMRDLLDAPRKKWESERQRVATEGWGADLLKRQDRGGTWGGGLVESNNVAGCSTTPLSDSTSGTSPTVQNNITS